MDPKTQYLDEVKSLPDQDLYRVRGVDAVEWAVPLFKGTARAKVHSDGKFRAVILMGHDDASLVGAPRDMVLGSFESMSMPDSIILDLVGYKFFFPGEPLQLGKQVEINDRILRVVGICNSSAPFVNLPVAYARYSLAVELVGQERNLMSFVVAKPRMGLQKTLLHGGLALPPASVRSPRPSSAGKRSGITSKTPEFRSTSASQSRLLSSSEPLLPGRLSISSSLKT